MQEKCCCLCVEINLAFLILFHRSFFRVFQLKGVSDPEDVIIILPEVSEEFCSVLIDDLSTEEPTVALSV